MHASGSYEANGKIAVRLRIPNMMFKTKMVYIMNTWCGVEMCFEFGLMSRLDMMNL